MRQLIVFALARIRGLEVLEADDGVDGLRKLAGGKFDIILTDINMPIMDGLKLVKRVRSDEAHKDMPIIIITTEGPTRIGSAPCARRQRLHHQAHPGSAGHREGQGAAQDRLARSDSFLRAIEWGVTVEEWGCRSIRRSICSSITSRSSAGWRATASRPTGATWPSSAASAEAERASTTPPPSSRAICSAYLVALSKAKLAARSQARNLVALRQLFRHLRAERHIARDPTADLELPRIGRPLPVVLTLREVEELLSQPRVDTARGLRDAAMLETLYATGLRVSELVQLRSARRQPARALLVDHRQGQKAAPGAAR